MSKSALFARAGLVSTAVRRALSGILFFTAVLAPLRAQADYPEAPVEEQEPPHEEGPATLNMLQLGVGFRYGIEMGGGGVDPWRAGFGGDVGYTLPYGIYVGALFELFFGSKGDEDARSNAWDLMVEGGYDVSLGESVVLRPKLGLGLGGKEVDCYYGGCDPSSRAGWAVAPGVKLIFLGESVSFLLDARFAAIFTDESAQAMVLSIGLGGVRRAANQ